MLPDLSHLLTNLADLPYLQGSQKISAAKTYPRGGIARANARSESLNGLRCFISRISLENDFNRPLKRSLSKAVVKSFGWTVKSKPEAHTLAKVAI